MRTHEEDRLAYAHLKQKLGEQYPNDIMAYCLGKEQFITEIDAKAGSMGLRMVRALTPRQWQAVRHLRQYYFFDRLEIEDPYIWTFDQPNHIHFVLLKGAETIGYAPIQLWPDLRAALRLIVIEEVYRNQGVGRQFLILCERWLQQQNVISIHIQASPTAYQFYCQAGYKKMLFNDPDGHPSDPKDIDIGKNLS